MPPKRKKKAAPKKVPKAALLKRKQSPLPEKSEIDDFNSPFVSPTPHPSPVIKFKSKKRTPFLPRSESNPFLISAKPKIEVAVKKSPRKVYLPLSRRSQYKDMPLINPTNKKGSPTKKKPEVIPQKPSSPIDSLRKKQRIRDLGAFYDPRDYQTRPLNPNQQQLPYYKLPYNQLPFVHPGNMKEERIRDKIKDYRQLMSGTGSPIQRLMFFEKEHRIAERMDKWPTPNDVPFRYRNSDQVPHEYYSKFGTWTILYDHFVGRNYLARFTPHGTSAVAATLRHVGELRAPIGLAYYIMQEPRYKDDEVYILNTPYMNSLPQYKSFRRESGCIIVPVNERATLVVRDGVLKAINVNGDNTVWFPIGTDEPIGPLLSPPKVHYW